MGDLKFKEEYDPSVSSRRKRKQGGLIGFMLRKRVVKNTAQANLVLIAVTVICIFIIYIMNTDSSKSIKAIDHGPEYFYKAGSEDDPGYRQ